MLRQLGLEDAALGSDYDPERLRNAAYALMQGLSPRMRTAVCRQPALTANGAALWTHLKATYAPRGIAGLLYAMRLCRDLKPGKTGAGEITGPQDVRTHIESCRSLWLLNSRQICPDITWGAKIEMLFRALESNWTSNFRFNLTERLQIKEEQGVPGNDIVEFAIVEMQVYAAGFTQTQSSNTAAEAFYTGTAAPKKPMDRSHPKYDHDVPAFKKGDSASIAARKAYFASETSSQKSRRLAARKASGETCAGCGEKGHFRCDPECPGKRPAAKTAEAHVTLVSDCESE